MSLVPSLLQAIVHVDGEALVIHAGEKPYVVTPKGQVQIASRALTLEAVSGIVSQLLPVDSQRALDEFGAAQYELPPLPEFGGERFTVVAARGGDDVWIEIRRRRVPDEDRLPDDLFGAPPPPGDVASQSFADDTVVLEHLPIRQQPEIRSVLKADDDVHRDDALSLPDESQLFPGHVASAAHAEVDEDLPMRPVGRGEEPAAIPATSRVAETVKPSTLASRAAASSFRPEPAGASPPPVHAESPRAAAPPVRVQPSEPAAPPVHVEPPPIVRADPPAKLVPPPRSAPIQPGVVLPMARNPIRADVKIPPRAEDQLSGLERLLRVAAARGASTLYLSSGERPSARVDGELQLIDGEPVLSPNDVVSLLLTLMPERSHEALRTGAATEWICDIEDIGRVRCMSFSDHRGPGGVFRLMPVRAVSVEQLGLSREIQALTIEPEGLIFVAGPRSSGKRTMIAALVDLINRTRRDHLITIEREVSIVHPRGSSFISQREVRGSDEDMLAAARAALREDPDVLVLEQIRNGGMMNVALEAASSGHLVIAGFSAHGATGAIDRMIDLYAPEYCRQVQLALADDLRGVIAQVLVKKKDGGRVCAREVLLNTAAVSSLIAEGKTSQLPMAIEGGRRHGMVPMNDTLVGLVKSGVVEASEAYRYVTDRTAFLNQLKRQGVDTTSVERLA